MPGTKEGSDPLRACPLWASGRCWAHPPQPWGLDPSLLEARGEGLISPKCHFVVISKVRLAKFKMRKEAGFYRPPGSTLGWEPGKHREGQVAADGSGSGDRIIQFAFCLSPGLPLISRHILASPLLFICTRISISRSPLSPV